MPMDGATQKEFDRLRAQILECDTVVRDDAPENETNISGLKSRVYQSGGTQQLQIQINGTWYEAALTAV